MSSMQEALKTLRPEQNGCPYCGGEVHRVKGKVIYPHRKDLMHLDFILCTPCNAYVGCHVKTGEPLGRLANKELRAAKMKAHAEFDPIWQNEDISRSKAYEWLSGKMGLHKNYTHIGMFDVEQCEQVVKICKERLNGHQRT